MTDQTSAICTRCGIDLDSGADCGDPYRCLGSEGEIEAEAEAQERRRVRKTSVEADIASAKAALATLLDAAISRALRPDRAWRIATQGLLQRIERLEASANGVR